MVRKMDQFHFARLGLTVTKEHTHWQKTEDIHCLVISLSSCYKQILHNSKAYFKPPRSTTAQMTFIATRVSKVASLSPCFDFFLTKKTESSVIVSSDRASARYKRQTGGRCTQTKQNYRKMLQELCFALQLADTFEAISRTRHFLSSSALLVFEEKERKVKKKRSGQKNPKL